MSEVWVTVVCVHVAWGGQGSGVAAKWTRPLSVPSVARTASPSVLTHRSPDAHAATLLCHLSFSYVMEWCRRLTDYSHRLGVQQWSRIHFTSSVPIHFDHLKVKKSSKLKLLFVRKVDLKKKIIKKLTPFAIYLIETDSFRTGSSTLEIGIATYLIGSGASFCRHQNLLIHFL